jgi:hypothetical protein
VEQKYFLHAPLTLPTNQSPIFSTCFNRIDLPFYEDKQELEEKLKIAITMASTGFYIE